MSNFWMWDDPELLRVRLNDLEIQRVRKVTDLGQVEVWEGRHRHEAVTIRRLTDAHKNKENVAKLVKEIKRMARLEHPTIVRLVGVAWSSPLDVQAVSEFMDSGDLATWLKTTSKTSLPWGPRKCQIAVDVAEAIVYMHSLDPPVTNSGISSHSILVDAKKGIKLNSFSYTRYDTYREHQIAPRLEVERWLDPQVIHGEMYSQSGDVYAFGAVLSELDTHKLPYEEISDAEGFRSLDLLLGVVTGKISPSFSPDCPETILTLARKCLDRDPTKRPLAVEVLATLRSFIQE